MTNTTLLELPPGVLGAKNAVSLDGKIHCSGCGEAIYEYHRGQVIHLGTRNGHEAYAVTHYADTCVRRAKGALS